MWWTLELGWIARLAPALLVLSSLLDRQVMALVPITTLGEAQMSKHALACVVVFGCLMASASLQAHHSTAGIYDPAKSGEVTGALSKLQFVNPHGSITITVKNPDGTTTDWTFTTGSATALAERGITKVGPNALKIGEQLTVTFMPARNGAPLGALRTVKRADGKIIEPPLN